PKLRAELNALPIEELAARLLQVDPAAVEKTDLRNKRRVVRALEIFMQTKSPASAQRSQWLEESRRFDGVFVYRERAELYARIDRGVKEMFAKGLIEEVGRAEKVGVTAEKTIGHTKIQQQKKKKKTSAKCVTAIQKITRRYAKRQLTWFRQQTNFESLN